MPEQRLNMNLIKKLGLPPETVEKIKDLHETREAIETAMEGTNDVPLLKALFEEWTEVQFDLQAAWGFKPDENYHKFWEVPKCTCPNLDNNDRWPIGHYIINQSCPVHGDS